MGAVTLAAEHSVESASDPSTGDVGWGPAASVVLVAATTAVIGRAPWPLAADVLLGVALFAAVIWSPPLGLVVLIAGSLANPLAVATGSATSVPFPVLIIPLLVAVWGFGAWRRGDWSVLRLPAVRAALALVGVAAVAGLVGNLPGLGFGRTAPLRAQLGAFAVYALSAAVLVVAADQLRDWRWLQRVTFVYLALAAVITGGRSIPELNPIGPVVFPAGSNGAMSWLWFAGLATGQIVFNRALNWRVRVLLALALAGELQFGIITGRSWLSGWMPPAVAVMVAICAGAPRVGLPLVALGGVGAALNLPRVIAGLESGDNLYSFKTRLEAWRILARIVAADPLLGLGPANYYHVTPLFPIRGYFVNFCSHNTFVDVLAQTGALGLACFLALLGLLARTGWQLRRRVSPGFVRAYVLGALGGLAGTIAAAGLADWVLPFVYNLTLAELRSSLPGWLFLGGLLAVGRSRDAVAAAPAVVMRARSWSTRRRLVAIAVVAVAVRVVVALALGDTAAPVSGAADQFSYDTLAQRLVAGHGFTFPNRWYPFTEADTPTAHWSYLYTAYLAAVYAAVGHHPLVARLVQAVVSALGCWLLFRIGRRLFDERVGLAAAALAAVYAYFVFFAAALMTQTFFILALLWAIDRALTIAVRPSAGAWGGLGVSLGIGTLLRQTLLLFAPVLLIWLVWTTPDPRRWRHAAGAVALLALCVLPWTAYNYTVFGDFLLLNSNGGYFFYAANHPDQGTDFDPTYAAPLPRELEGEGEPAIDRALFRSALGFIAADPVRFLRLCWSRAGSYFWLLPSPRSTPTANVARLASFTLYLPLMLYGLARSRTRWRQCTPLYLYLAFDTALHLTSWAAPRYRLPSDALLMVFAGLAVVELAARLGAWRRA